MNETVCQFGPDNGLTGILAEPHESVRVADAPVALILNAGIVHNIGPFRLHVDIARMLAAAGFSSLRIDVSGLGDSETRTGKFVGNNRAKQDAVDAMNYLAEHNDNNRFVVVGLCSGAFNAHQVAISDPRVVGTALFDGIVFRTLGFYFRHYARMARPRFWRNAIKRRMIGEPAAYEAAGESLGESEFFELDNTRDEVAEEISGLVDRGVRMLFMYTDGYDDIASASQFKAMFGIKPNDQVQVEYFNQAEHTFRLKHNRNAACERLTDWYRGQFADVAVAGEASLAKRV